MNIEIGSTHFSSTTGQFHQESSGPKNANTKAANVFCNVQGCVWLDITTDQIQPFFENYTDSFTTLTLLQLGILNSLAADTLAGATIRFTSIKFEKENSTTYEKVKVEALY